MRLSNRKKAPIYSFILTLSTLSALVGGGMTFLNIINLPVFGKAFSIFLLAMGILGFFIIFIKGRHIFEYDSDGEALNFKNHAIIPFLGNDARDEFPKYKLISYEIIDTFLFKRLYIKITSKKHKESTLKYDISYLTSSEIRDLKLSLNRTIKQNKETEKEE